MKLVGKENEINNFLQGYLRENSLKELSAPEAGKLLDRNGILPDRPNKSGRNLRFYYLQKGLTKGAAKEGGRWVIRLAKST